MPGTYLGRGRIATVNFDRGLGLRAGIGGSGVWSSSSELSDSAMMSIAGQVAWEVHFHPCRLISALGLPCKIGRTCASSRVL